MTRHEAREHLFCLLFQQDFYESSELENQMDSYFSGLDKPLSEKNQKEIMDKLKDLLAHLAEVDVYIEKYATGWRIDRIAKVELAILRIAVYEICMDENVPEKVAINEAVELAKVYGQDNAPSFINGILAKVVRE